MVQERPQPSRHARASRPGKGASEGNRKLRLDSRDSRLESKDNRLDSKEHRRTARTEKPGEQGRAARSAAGPTTGAAEARASNAGPGPRGGQQSNKARVNRARTRPQGGKRRAARAGQQPEPRRRRRRTETGRRRRISLRASTGCSKGRQAGPGGPITGEGFRQWSDRMRDVEELLDDPELRAEAAGFATACAGPARSSSGTPRSPTGTSCKTLVADPIEELAPADRRGGPPPRVARLARPDRPRSRPAAVRRGRPPLLRTTGERPMTDAVPRSGDRPGWMTAALVAHGRRGGRAPLELRAAQAGPGRAVGVACCGLLKGLASRPWRSAWSSRC